MTDQTQPAAPIEDEIDLLALAKKLWLGRKTIFQTMAVFALFGILVALSSPKQYTATSTIVPQLGGDSGSKMGGLGGLAALAGINLDMQQGSDLSPIVYPQIVNSITFQLELMNTPLNFEDIPQPVTLFDYVTKLQKPSALGILKKYTLGLPGLILSALKGVPKEGTENSNNELKPLSLTQDQVRVQKLIKTMVSLNVNAKEGYLTIVANLEEPLIAAQMTLMVQNLLQKYITQFKTQKSQANLDFIETSFLEAKKEFEQAQIKLAIATDRSKAFTNGLSKIETDRLQSQYTITFGVYQELAKQYEQAKIQVKKDTPVFTVVDPPVVPSKRTKPNRSLIVIVWLFLGGVTGASIILGRDYIMTFKNKWENT
jgi:uncharacterized protein involved in exopolysaccharide biosynthesis